MDRSLRVAAAVTVAPGAEPGVKMEVQPFRPHLCRSTMDSAGSIAVLARPEREALEQQLDPRTQGLQELRCRDTLQRPGGPRLPAPTVKPAGRAKVEAAGREE